MNGQLEIGYLLRASISSLVAGCQVTNIDLPTFGALVRVPLDKGYQTYGLIHNIHIDDDGLVRQLATADTINENIIADNRLHRNVPLEISVLAVGFRHNDQISHLSPPRPPLSLDKIYLCEDQDICEFTTAGRFGYFRHILRATDTAREELLASHLKQAQLAHESLGDSDWINQAAQELIVLLRDDYSTLMNVLSVIRDFD
jgi:hypothetical protein